MLVITYKHYLEYKKWEARKIGNISCVAEDEIEEILNKSKIKEEEFMTLAERIKKNQSEERKRAKREGVKEGVKETKIEIATKMIKDKMDIDIISRITGLNKNIIMTLK